MDLLWSPTWFIIVWEELELRFKCSCCGNFTLNEETDAICKVCFWQEDIVQRVDPFFKGGANEESLIQARMNYRLFGACSKDFIHLVRQPLFEELPVVSTNSKSGEDVCKKPWIAQRLWRKARCKRRKLFSSDASPKTEGVRNPFQSLVGSVAVVIVDIVLHNPVQLSVGKYNKMVQTLPANRTDKAFGVGVHVRRIRHNWDTLEIILLVRKPAQLAGIVVDKRRTP